MIPGEEKFYIIELLRVNSAWRGVLQDMTTFNPRHYCNTV